MPQSLVQIYVHVIFSTRDRVPFLRDLQVRDQMHRYLSGIFKKLRSPAITVGGVADHVHVLCRFAKSARLEELLRDAKRDSSKWIKTAAPRLREFHWQAGYGAFSVSSTHVDALTEYIASQEEHHRRESFQEEFRRLCRINHLAIDERYVWD